jgi:hypothetical protein
MGSATYFARAVSYTHEMFTKLTTGDILIKPFFSSSLLVREKASPCQDYQLGVIFVG